MSNQMMKCSFIFLNQTGVFMMLPKPAIIFYAELIHSYILNGRFNMFVVNILLTMSEF